MPLFIRSDNELILMRPKAFKNEKEMQTLIEANLKEMFNCRFVASEFSTGPVHGGRIDTLALSEDDNPVIIEYKIIESSQLINQSLYYLSWMNDHRGDFTIAVQRAFPNENIKIDWSDIRVICIAPDYKKYDLHAVKMMGSSIELWQYRYYVNGAFFIEEIFRRTCSISKGTDSAQTYKNPIMVQAGKKAAITRATGIYTTNMHFNRIIKSKLNLVIDLQEFILSIDDSIEETPKKFYIAYKTSQNFVCMEIQKNKILLFLKIKPGNLGTLPDNCRDVSEIGHYGTGDLEVTVNEQSQLETAKELIVIAYNNIGGK